MKTKEKMNSCKQEAEAMNKKPAELTVDELMQVSGGRYVQDDDVLLYQKIAEEDGKIS